MSVLLSVIIPTFNRANLLKKAVKSVQEQDFNDLEIIISDDHSKDETAQVVKQMQVKDSRIRYVLNEKYKQGPNGNKNNGLDAANGEFVMILDDDDELLPNAIKTLLEKTKCGFDHVFGNCLIEENQILSNKLSGRGLNSDTEVSKKDFLMGKFSGEFLSVFKKSLLKNYRFNDEFYGNEATLWVHLYEGKSFYIHKAFRIYRVNRDDSVTKSALNNAFRVYLGYFELAKILENELVLTQDKDYKRQCAMYYKMAAYYAKLAKEFKKMYFCLFKSLKIQLNMPAFILLILSVVPNRLIVFLSKIRVRLTCKN